MAYSWYKEKHVETDDVKKLVEEYRGLKTDCEKLINESLGMLFSECGLSEIDDESAILLAKCNNLLVKSFKLMDTMADGIKESAENMELLDKKLDIIIETLDKKED